MSQKIEPETCIHNVIITIPTFAYFYWLLYTPSYRPLHVSRGTEEGVFVLTMTTALRESWGNPNSSHAAGTHGARNAWLKWLLLMSGDVEINPGPVYRFPCTVCETPVRKNQRGVDCDSCRRWTHAACCGMSATEYHQLCTQGESFPWVCPPCMMQEIPFMNCSLNWEPVHGHKSVDGLLKTSQLSDGSESYMNSLPKPPFPGLSCMCLNARSIVNKNLDLLAMLDANRMHILAVSETFLDDNILNSERGCSSYTIFRRDRDRQGGGVMLLVHNTIPATRRFDLESDCEILWTELRMQPTSILFGVYYRPPRTDQRYPAQLHHSLTCIPESYPIVLCGDFNIAHIDWEIVCPTSHCTLASVLCDLANDFSLQQLVSNSTRRGNLLVFFSPTP